MLKSIIVRTQSEERVYTNLTIGEALALVGSDLASVQMTDNCWIINTRL